MVGATGRIMVPFAGAGAGTGPLTWAQEGVRWAMRRTGNTMNIGGAMPLPPGTPVEQIARELRFIVSRHPSLRTRYRFPAGGVAEQVVSDAGEIPLEIFDVPPDRDPAEVADEVRVHYEFTPFDYVEEWPVRMGVVRVAGALTHVVVMYCHLAVDGDGIGAIVRDLTNLDRSTGAELGPPAPATQPLELAAWQAGPAGRRQSDHALRQWERMLRAVPPRRFGRSAAPQEPRYWELVVTSPAVRLALDAVAARTRLQTGQLLLAAQAIALGRVTGNATSVAQVLVNNRFRPGLADSVSQLTQVGLCVIDVADSTFDEVAVRAFRAAMAAYKMGYYDTLGHQALLERIDREIGEHVDVSCFVNDRRSQALSEPEPEPEPQAGAGAAGEAADPGALDAAAQVQAALPLTTMRWGLRQDGYDGTFYLHIDSAGDAVQLTLWADTHHLAPDDLWECARQIEAVLVSAVSDPAAPTGVRAAVATTLS
jgi:hypothetical protein